MRVVNLSLPLLNSKTTVRFVRNSVLASYRPEERPAWIVVQRGHSYRLVEVVEVILAYSENPNRTLGELLLQDIVHKTSRGRIDPQLLEKQVAGEPWANWILVATRRKLLLCYCDSGMAHFVVREVTHFELARNAPHCVCKNKHGYQQNEIPNDRPCTYCRP